MKSFKNILFICKGIVLISILAIMISTFSSPKDSQVDFDTVWNTMVANVDLSNLEERDNQGIKRFLSLDPDTYESIRYYKSIDDMKADEIVLVKFKSHADQETFKSTLTTHISEQEDIFAGYAPDEEQLLEDSVLYVQANYGLFVFNTNAQTICNQFLSGIEG